MLTILLLTVIIALLATIFRALLYLQRMSRWYYLKNREYCEENRRAIVQLSAGNVVGERFYDDFDSEQRNLFHVDRLRFFNSFLDSATTCPLCFAEGRCPGSGCKKPL
jgi:hypothetical protein